ncbi:KilA-N domain-containing protein [Achromobacter xylosoxidans]
MNALIIATTAIRQDEEGRFSLNDLHRAAGGERRHQPSDWVRLQQTQDLIAELGDMIPGFPESSPGRAWAPTLPRSWSTPTPCGSVPHSTCA